MDLTPEKTRMELRDKFSDVNDFMRKYFEVVVVGSLDSSQDHQVEKNYEHIVSNNFIRGISRNVSLSESRSGVGAKTRREIE